MNWMNKEFKIKQNTNAMIKVCFNLNVNPFNLGRGTSNGSRQRRQRDDDGDASDRRANRNDNDDSEIGRLGRSTRRKFWTRNDFEIFREKQRKC